MLNYDILYGVYIVCWIGCITTIYYSVQFIIRRIINNYRCNKNHSKYNFIYYLLVFNKMELLKDAYTPKTLEFLEARIKLIEEEEGRKLTENEINRIKDSFISNPIYKPVFTKNIISELERTEETPQPRQLQPEPISRSGQGKKKKYIKRKDNDPVKFDDAENNIYLY